MNMEKLSPKFAQIKHFILAEIKSGKWQEHDKVPSENALASQFHVSRMTARRALTELTEAGVLTRSQGQGTFVASLKSQSSMLEIRNIADEVKERGNKHASEAVVMETIQALAPIAIALGVEEDQDVFHSIIVHYENGHPLQVEERFVNPAFAPDYLEQNFARITPHEYLCQVAPLTEARHTVEAVTPAADICQWLNLINAEPCIQIIRRTWSNDGVVSFTRLISAGSKYRLGGHLTFKAKQTR